MFSKESQFFKMRFAIFSLQTNREKYVVNMSAIRAEDRYNL